MQTIAKDYHMIKEELAAANKTMVEEENKVLATEVAVDLNEAWLKKAQEQLAKIQQKRRKTDRDIARKEQAFRLASFYIFISDLECLLL